MNAANDQVYIVDDDEFAAEAVAALVREMGIRADIFPSAEKFLEAYDGHRPACLVTDVRMLRMSGLELQEQLRARGSRMAVIVLTAYAETAVVIRAMRGGAYTLLEKPCRNFELWDAIRAALLEDAQRSGEDQLRESIRHRLTTLSPAEKQVLERMLAGDPNKNIAAALDISIRTVEVRRQSIFTKLEAGSLAELVRMVVSVDETTP